MDMIPSNPQTKSLTHLSWNYPLSHKSTNPAGIFMGINAFKDFFSANEALTTGISSKLGKFYGLMHANGIDAYDMEFVYLACLESDCLTKWNIFGYDFDKSSHINMSLPPKSIEIKRKVDENIFQTLKGRVRIFGRSMSYFPIKEELYRIFANSYIQTRKEKGQEEEATKVIAYHESFLTFETE